MVFCNTVALSALAVCLSCHNPYFNRWFSAIISNDIYEEICNMVTILILIDGFLQYAQGGGRLPSGTGHNPYFNRWFSAISVDGINVFEKAQSQSLF